MQNGAPHPGNGGGQGNAHNAQGNGNVAWDAWPAPPPLVMPPHLVNYQAWLHAQGLTFQDGIVPDNNITDNAFQAWNI